MKAQTEFSNMQNWIDQQLGYTVPKIQKGKSYRVNISDKEILTLIVNYLSHNHRGENCDVWIDNKYYGIWAFSIIMHYQQFITIPGTTVVNLKRKNGKIVRV